MQFRRLFRVGFLVLLESVYGLLEMLHESTHYTLFSCTAAVRSLPGRVAHFQMLLASTVIACVCAHSHTGCCDESICVLQRALIMAVECHLPCSLVQICCQDKPQDAALQCLHSGTRVYRPGLDATVRQFPYIKPLSTTACMMFMLLLRHSSLVTGGCCLGGAGASRAVCKWGALAGRRCLQSISGALFKHRPGVHICKGQGLRAGHH